jgi:ABC-type multidrug transport system fused ATPase/permease subunit
MANGPLANLGQNGDMIHVIGDGDIIESGSHNELFAGDVFSPNV